MFELVCSLAHSLVRSGAFALGSSDEEIVAVKGNCARVPVGRNEAQSGQGGGLTRRIRIQRSRYQILRRIGGRVGHEETLPVRRVRQRAGISPGKLLMANRAVKKGNDLPLAVETAATAASTFDRAT